MDGTFTRDDHRAVMQTMVERHGSDPNAKDLARVLRLPGFLHQKGVPFMVRLTGDGLTELDLDLAKTYSRDEILAAFPPAQHLAPIAEATPCCDVARFQVTQPAAWQTLG